MNITPYIAICGIVLIIGWAIYLRATFRSLGMIGLALAALLFGSFIWLFFDLGWLNSTNVSILEWVTLALLSLILALGMSWSHVRRRLTGQVDTDDVENAPRSNIIFITGHHCAPFHYCLPHHQAKATKCKTIVTKISILQFELFSKRRKLKPSNNDI